MKLNKALLQSIIFDLDGTLIDTAPDVRLALNHTLAVYGEMKINTHEIYPLIGGGVRVMIQKAFEKNNRLLRADEIDAAIICYLNYYKANPVVATKIYPGVVEVLKILRSSGIKLGICTNKPSIMTKLVLNKLNLDHFFSAVVSADEVVKPKPDSHHINEVLRKMRLSALQTVLVGDSELDKLGAQNAGIPFIGVSYGYNLEMLRSAIIINHFRELPEALTTIGTSSSWQA